jgi:hypothetical protein
MRYAKDDAKIYGSGAEFPGSAGIGVAVGKPIVQIPPPTDGFHIRSTTDDAEHVEAW